MVRTEGGIEITALWGRQYDLMAVADLAITIPGTNTFELAAFGTPAMIALPLTHPERVPLEGIPGLIGRIPGVGRALKKRLVPKVIAKLKYTAWPNRLAQEMVIPELRGQVTAADVSQAAVDLLTDAGRREKMSRRLRELVGAPGAARPVGAIYPGGFGGTVWGYSVKGFSLKRKNRIPDGKRAGCWRI